MFARILALFVIVPFIAHATHATRVGLWYTAWWTADDARAHWAACHRFPVRGRYSAGDPDIIRAQYQRMREIGIDFLIMDDTNGRNNDGGRIRENIRAWFDFMDTQPAAERIAICIGGGGEMRSGGRASQQQAADDYWTWWAQRPSYFHLDGKPLLLVDTDTNYGPGDFDDPRFSVRWAYNSDNSIEIGQRRTWGWGSEEPVPVLPESMSIMPGQRYPSPIEKQGYDPRETPREGGNLYARMWCAVLEARPRFVTIADWNNFREETAIEDSWTWEDPDGRARTSLYSDMTRVYTELLDGRLIEGVCYRAANATSVLHCLSGRLEPVPRAPRRSLVHPVPPLLLEQLRNAP